MNINFALDHYLKQREKQVSHASIKHSRFRLSLFMQYLFQHNINTVLELNAEVLHGFQHHLKAKTELAHNTVYSVMLDVRQFVTFLFEAHFIVTDLGPGMMMPKAKKSKPKVWGDSEIQRCFSKIDPNTPLYSRDVVLVRLKKQYGLYAVEIADLSILDIDMSQGRIRVAKRRKYIQVNSKALQDLRVYIRDRQRLRPAHDRLIVGHYGKPLGEQRIGIIVRGYRL